MLKKYLTQSNLIFLLVIILIGIFLRVYKINTNYYFSGELGKELLYIRQYVLNGALPIVGMATSHSWLYYGPIYYWIMIPIFNIFNGNPYILFWVALAVSVVGLILNYLVVKKVADEKIAIISTMIQALTPLLIWQTRLSKLHVFFWILMPMFMYLLSLMWNEQKQSSGGWGKIVFFAGLVFGIMFSFHFSQIPIIGVVVLLFWIKKDIYKFIDWLKFGAGVLIPNITLVWQDKNIALWLPYRIINVMDKNPSGTLPAIAEYLGKNIFWDQKLQVVGVLVFVILFIKYVYSTYKHITQSFMPFYIITTISFMLIANILHGAPPIHYFLPIFTTVPILYSYYLAKFKYWPLIIASVVLINIFSFTKEPLFYKDFTGNIPGTDIVSYSTQNNATTFIINQAGGQEFSIKRVGPFDYFPDEYSQSYKYLTLWKGGKLIDNSSNIYSIIENERGVYVQK